LRMDELGWLWLQKNAHASDDTALPQNDYQLPPAPVTVAWELQGTTFEWDGVLSRYEGVGIDERTRTVPCRVLVADPRKVRVRGTTTTAAAAAPRALVRGMYVQLTIHAQPDIDLLRLPSQAVQPGNVVWQVQNGKLKRIQLSQVRLSGADVLVPPCAAALTIGDQIVASPLANPTEGEDVKIHTPEIIPSTPVAKGDSDATEAKEAAEVSLR